MPPAGKSQNSIDIHKQTDSHQSAIANYPWTPINHTWYSGPAVSIFKDDSPLFKSAFTLKTKKVLLSLGYPEENFADHSFRMCSVLQYTGIFSNFQYLMHSGINNDDTGISCVLKIA